MASWKSWTSSLFLALVALALLACHSDAGGPMLIFKGGKGHGGGMGGGALATLLAAGAVAKLLQSNHGHEQHHVEPVFVPIPIKEMHGGGGGGMEGWW